MSHIVGGADLSGRKKIGDSLNRMLPGVILTRIYGKSSLPIRFVWFGKAPGESKMKRLILLAALFLLPLSADQNDMTFIPSTPTVLVNRTASVTAIWLANTTGSAVTVTFRDQSTNCNSGACNWWPTISVAANTVYAVEVPGISSEGGIVWSASTANAVIGQLTYR